MAYRLIYSEFWTDPRVMEEMTPEDKFFYLYILTNPSTTSCGIYTISKMKMAHELSYSIEAVNTLMERFERHHKLITYNKETRELAIRNWGKYNLCRGGKPVMDCLSSELRKVKDKNLLKYVGENIKNGPISDLFNAFYDTTTDRCRDVPRQVDNTITGTNTDTDTDTNTDTNTITDTNTVTENDIHCGTLLDTNIVADSCAVTKTISNSKEDRDIIPSIDTSIEPRTAIIAIADTDEYTESAAKAYMNTKSNSLPRKEDPQNLSISLVVEYEKLTGHVGVLNIGAVKMAVIHHGYDNVKNAMDKALERGKLHMPYVNAILKAWAKDGYPKGGDNNGYSSLEKNKLLVSKEFAGFKPHQPRGLTDTERRKVEEELL